MTRTIGIFVFDDVEVLDFAGPYEVFTCATRVSGKIAPDAPPPFRVKTIGQTPAMLRARAGLSVMPEAHFADAGKIDVLIVPGGVVTAELAKPAVAQWIAARADACELVASVCTGAFLLAQAGLLDGQDVTTHWADIDDLRAMFPQLHVQPQRRWIDNGRTVTSGGISAGMDMSLHLVERLAGRELALRTARQMEYDWNEA
ncbi:DJ-1/PfpI family protein [Rugamonas sp. CCM 8940]|uniref:DJ-1/PfpI family protein n=1 Tax=Rugamonas sp. CCM 8940 TaxID=2765359 RepID=UPI0018F62646|nr:DJ-1/PfpI family protein [Rugamonas sp. CCM 8940]MBJ7312940.1 DJ-1/PfpI family protein [Rugamonas sp. CCM 8940]